MKRAPSVQLWSAAPTPLADNLTVDAPSVARMIRDAIASGVEGVFLGGTCGEGPWLPDRERCRLVEAAAKEGKGRIEIAVQATDNSAPRILDNIRQARDSGADYA